MEEAFSQLSTAFRKCGRHFKLWRKDFCSFFQHKWSPGIPNYPRDRKNSVHERWEGDQVRQNIYKKKEEERKEGDWKLIVCAGGLVGRMREPLNWYRFRTPCCCHRAASHIGKFFFCSIRSSSFCLWNGCPLSLLIRCRHCRGDHRTHLCDRTKIQPWREEEQPWRGRTCERSRWLSAPSPIEF